ncbi:hypothetical protein [Bacillus litorisediminis]|nr:hypothetical protein [Bacillus litorisediminis]
MKDKTGPKAGENVLYKGDEGQNQVKNPVKLSHKRYNQENN